MDTRSQARTCPTYSITVRGSTLNIPVVSSFACECCSNLISPVPKERLVDSLSHAAGVSTVLAEVKEEFVP